MAKEIVRCNGLDRVHMALDYFDASINRISAWIVGFCSWQKALLFALCTPNELFKELQDSNRFTELMVLQEEMKTYPYGEIWSEYCKQCGLSGDSSWLKEIETYEREVLALR